MGLSESCLHISISPQLMHEEKIQAEVCSSAPRHPHTGVVERLLVLTTTRITKTFSCLTPTQGHLQPPQTCSKRCEAKFLFMLGKRRASAMNTLCNWPKTAEAQNCNWWPMLQGLAQMRTIQNKMSKAKAMSSRHCRCLIVKGRPYKISARGSKTKKRAARHPKHSSMAMDPHIPPLPVLGCGNF